MLPGNIHAFHRGSDMERRFVSSVFGITAFLLSCGISSAQWFDLPLPGTPRTADGKPNLAAPAPRAGDGKPDLSGIWRIADSTLLGNLAANEPGGAPFQTWAAAVYKERQENLAKDRPTGRCLPHGIPDSMMVRSGPFKIVQNPGMVLILLEEFNHYRQFFSDGRGFPQTMTPAWFGYSLGKWEGDVFVVTTKGFNDQSWLDDPGHPHTDAMQVTEKFTRRDFGHLAIQITIDDPKAYTRPWTVNARFDLMPDTELIENICENEKDTPHLVGK
jgi:hypothetical protein